MREPIFSAGNPSDGRLCCDQFSFLQPCHILSDGVDRHTDCITNGFVAWVALVCLSVFAEKQIAVNCKLAGMQLQLKDLIRNKKTIFDWVSLWPRFVRQSILLSPALRHDPKLVMLFCKTNIRVANRAELIFSLCSQIYDSFRSFLPSV